MGKTRMQRDVCGVPIWLLREYLVELGGNELDEGWVKGQGWHAQLTQIEDKYVGSLSVGQVRVEIEGETDVMEIILPDLEKKLLRAGG